MSGQTCAKIQAMFRAEFGKVVVTYATNGTQTVGTPLLTASPLDCDYFGALSEFWRRVYGLDGVSQMQIAH